MNSDIDYIENELRLTRSKTAPWPPLSGHILNAYTRLETLRTPVIPPPPAGDTPPVPGKALLFSDEFNGTTIDTNKWEGKGFKAPSGTQWSKLANSSLDGNGNLVITAKKNATTGQWYSDFLAGRADNGFSYKGPRYVCARVKVPAGLGTFPAAPWEWAAPYGNGPIEIDYMEVLGREITKIHTTLHPWLATGDHPIGNANDVGIDLSKDFHVYGGAVYADHIDFYCDGKKIWTLNATGSGLNDLTTYPVVPCIDLDMGGWGGTIDPNMTEASMLVDYFRVYAL